ncbi:MAG TPA: hypothetical protein EYG86_04930 [Crocinitomicaceae bacterium]|nr:hypothetical protein [Crocinitomicaceae bacterium]
MNNQTKIGLVGGIVLLMVLMVWMFSSGGDADIVNKNGRKPYISSNWTKRFELYDKKPLGLFLFTSLAKAHIDSSSKVMIAKNWGILDSLINSSPKKKSFLFVGNNFGLLNNELELVLNEVEEGAELFIAYNNLTDNVQDELFVRSSNSFEYNAHVKIKTIRRSFQMINLYQNDTVATDWNTFGTSKTYGAKKSLSKILGQDNFIRINHGKGKIHLLSTPTVFYNYQVKRMLGYKYAEYALNQIPKNQDIILLELGRLSDDFGTNNDNYLDDIAEEFGKRDDSYLTLLFQNPTLLKAMLLAIIGILLFVIFRSKRKRPVVPYVKKKKDMTLAFAETITSIYYSKRNPHGLLQVQKKNFYAMVQKHFYLDLNRKDQENVRNSLAEKSNYNRKDIEQLVDLYDAKEENVNDQYVANVLSQQQAFYKSVGIISDKTKDRIKERETVYRRSMLIPSIFILSGVFLFFFGLYYLVASIGIGIIFWPVGVILVILGIIRLSQPFLIVNGKSWRYYSLYGKKKEYNSKEITNIELLTDGAKVNFGTQERLIINYKELSRFDQKQLKQFISKLHTQEL